ncbi:hypothetical protein DFH01_24955 [Falsiroseomonas bella]|uniref:Uncharacterized protein n=1 Tax=Falsiroseomonas bella TaxID=2184016 RepID=A0A317F551_9PROT|nr:hypothetical protein DFH01_24955 [Falsiroseomonas bella]
MAFGCSTGRCSRFAGKVSIAVRIGTRHFGGASGGAAFVPAAVPHSSHILPVRGRRRCPAAIVVLAMRLP